MYTIKWTGLQPTEAGWSPPSDTTQWVPAQQSESQGKFRGSGTSHPLEHPGPTVAQPPARAALSLLREWEGNRPVPQWQHWIVAVEPTGRITLPLGARGVLAHLDRSRDRLA